MIAFDFYPSPGRVVATVSMAKGTFLRAGGVLPFGFRGTFETRWNGWLYLES
jgi:hypothetical protein